MAHPIPMPARGERGAPIFDKTKARELPRFFDEFEYLIARAAITADTDKKRQLLRYVDYDVEQMWKTFPEYTDVTKTYDNFKDAVLIHYPDATGDYVYSLRDMDLLIGESQRVGINTLTQLSEFHMQFFAISQWLITKQQLGDLEQKRAYIRAFQPALLASVTNRLQLKFPDHHPNIPHKIQDVYDAARFILQCSPSPAMSYYAPTPSASPATLPPVQHAPGPQVKTESFTALFTELTKSIVEALNTHGTSHGPSYTGNSSKDCYFCGGPHLTKECECANDYCKAGKCKRGSDNRIVLPSGAQIPREIPGRLIRDKLDEWHRRNPGHIILPTSVLLHTIATSPQSPAPVPAYQLSTTDRIATLEAELFNLRARNQGPTSGIRTRAQRAREADENPAGDGTASPSRPFQTPYSEEIADKAPPAPERVPEIIITQNNRLPRIEEVEDQGARPAPPAIISRPPAIVPEHPYRAARDAAYTPPAARNVGAPARFPAPVKRPEPAYKTLPPIHDVAIATNVYKRSMDAPITITQRELYSLSPEVRAQVRENITTRRIPNAPDPTTQHFLQAEEGQYGENVPLVTFAVPNAHYRIPPEGSTILTDPIEAYYQSLPPGETPDLDKLTVARPSAAIRSIYALVDNSQKKECTLDPGCQVIAMSENTCHSLGLAYDPNIRLNMESANGSLDWSLGLSRNVPFQVGAVTLYMQVHVIRSPAYDILLGRPFDILTESVVKNFANEDQTITISDPNSNQQVTIPTFARKGVSANALAIQDFQ